MTASYESHDHTVGNPLSDSAQREDALVHNHPSGDPNPSRADIEMTKKVAAAAAALGIVVHDHLIIGRGTHSSFKSLGLL